MSTPRIARYVRGGEPRFVPLKPAIRIDDAKLEELRMAYPGSTGRPRSDMPKGGLKAIARKLGCHPKTVSRHLRKIAEREEQ
jgi:hypothetical protein